MREHTETANEYEGQAPYQLVGLVLGPALFALMMLLEPVQETMEPVAWRTAAVAIWMAVWWATEAIAVPATAFLPIVLFAPLGIASIREAAVPYANPVIYLYLGGFMLALAVERWNLHRRIALAVLAKTGTEGRRLIGGFMLTAALLSMWMTNTSTTMLLLPIVLSVNSVILDNVEGLDDRSRRNFTVALLLGLAFGATIGGLATLVGTPPNALLAAYLEDTYGIEISFASWLAVGVPVSASMLVLAWLTLTRFVYPVHVPESAAVQSHLNKLRQELGRMGAAEIRVAVIFALVVSGWVLRRPLSEWFGIQGLTDAGIAMTAALALFIVPSGEKGQAQLMTWHDAGRLPWGVLILFGGGLSLAAAVADSGLAKWLGDSLVFINQVAPAALVIAAAVMVIFLTELTSNSATTATFLPVMGAIAIQVGVSPIVLCVPIALAASCAFMLPVATPPNAIVFASGMITIPQMIRPGFYLNLMGVIIVSIASIWLVPMFLA